MAIRGNNRGQGATINWKDVSRAAGQGANITFNVIMPNTSNAARNSTGVMRDIRMAARSQRVTNRAQNNLNTDAARETRKAFDAFNRAFRDIEKGQYSIDRISGELVDTYNSDINGSFDMPTGERANDMSAEQITLIGNRGVAQAVMESSNAQMKSMSELGSQLISISTRNTEALARSVNASINRNFMMLNNTLYMTNAKIDNVNAQLSAMIQFNNQNTLKFYNSMSAMMNGMGQMMENLNTSMTPNVKDQRKFDVRGGVRGYIDYVKQGVMESLLGSSISTMHQIGIGKAAKGGIVDAIVNAVVPKSIATIFKSIDKDFSRMGNELLSQLADKLDNSVLGKFGLGGILGNKRTKVGGINMSGFSREALPWNGTAQRYLTEVIPDYLASIEAALTKDEKRHYNSQSGKFMTESQIRERYESETLDRMRVLMNEPIAKLTEAISATGMPQVKQNRLMKQLEAVLDDLATDTGDPVKKRNQMKTLMQNRGVSDNAIYEFIREATENMELWKDQVNEFYAQVGQTGSVYRHINNREGQNISRGTREAFRNHQVNYRKSTKIGNPRSYIQARLTRYGLPDNGVSDDPVAQNSVMIAAMNGMDEDDIELIIRSEYDRVRIQETGGIFAPVKGLLTPLADKVAPTLQRGANAYNRVAFEATYGGGIQRGLENGIASARQRFSKTDEGESVGQGRYGRSGNYRTFDNSVPLGYGRGRGKKKNRGAQQAAQQRAIKAVQSAEAMSLDSTDHAMRRSSQDIAGQDRMMKKNMEQMSEIDPNDTVESSIIKSNNSLRVAMATLVGSFKNFGASIFGKDGWISRMWNSDARKKVTGRLFTDEDAIFGKQYQAVRKWGKETWENTKDTFRRGYDYVYDSAMKYKYGEDYENDERYQNNKFWQKIKPKKSFHEAADEATESLETVAENVEAAGEAIVGDMDSNPEKKKEKMLKDFQSKMKGRLPKALAAGAVGATVGALNASSSLLGWAFLPGGPLAGAIVGAGMSILSGTETFKTILYGKEMKDNNGNSLGRQGGLISKELGETFKKAAPMVVGGAAVGALHGAIKSAVGFNSGIGVFGMALTPGGILGGALLGAGLGLLKNSDKFQTMLFGEKDDTGKRSGKFLSDGFNKINAGIKAAVPTLKKGAIGAGVGALSGLVLSNMGFLPAMLSLGGPIGMGIAGLGLGIASSTSKFNEWMFGTDKVDKDGNVIGKNKDGFLSQVANTINTNVIEPIADQFKSKMADLADWLKLQIKIPFQRAFGPILSSIEGIKDDVTQFVKEKFDAIGAGITSLFSSIMKKIFSPITRLIGTIGKGVIGALGTGTRLALAPLSAGLQGLSLLTSKDRRAQRRDFRKRYKEARKNGDLGNALEEKWAQEAEENGGRGPGFFQRLNDRMDLRRGRGEFADAFRQGYIDDQTAEGNNVLGWMNTYQEARDIKTNRKARHKEERMWKKIDNERRRIKNKELDNREVELNDYTVRKYRNSFEKLGIDKKYLQTSDDINNLLFRREDFKTHMRGEKTADEKKAEYEAKGGWLGQAFDEVAKSLRITEDDKTKERQDRMADLLDKIYQEGVQGSLKTIENNQSREMEEDWAHDRRELRGKLKRAKVKSVDIYDPRLRDWAVEELSTKDIKEFAAKGGGDVDAFIDWMYTRGITQKSGTGYNPIHDPLEAIPDVNGKSLSELKSKLGLGEDAKMGWTGGDITKIGSYKLDVNGKWRDNGKFVSNDVSALLNNIVQIQKDLLLVNKEQLKEQEATTEAAEDTADATINAATEGTADRGVVTKNRGKGLKSFFGSFFRKKKEESETEQARALGDNNDEPKKKKSFLEAAFDDASGNKEKKKGVFATIWEKIKGVGALLGGSILGKAGSFILKGVKLIGGIGLFAGLGFTIAEMIKPGITDGLSKKIESANKTLNEADQNGLGLFGLIKEKISSFWDKKAEPWITTKIDGISTWWEETGEPKWLEFTEKAGNFVLETIPNSIIKVADWIGEHAVLLGETAAKVTETLIVPLGILFGNVIKGAAKGIWKEIKKHVPFLKNVNDPDFGDLSDAEVSRYQASGKNINEQVVATAGTEDEARDKATKLGYDNAVITQNPDTGTYTVTNRRFLGGREVTTDRGKTTKVESTDATNTLAAGAKMATLLATGNGAGIKTAAQLTGKLIKPAAALAHGATATVKVGTGILSKVPVVGKLFKPANAVAGAANAVTKTASKALDASTAETTTKTLTTILNTAKKALEKIGDSKVIQAVMEKFSGYLGSHSDGVLAKIIDFMKGLFDDVAKGASKFSAKLTNLAEAAAAKFNTKVTVGGITLGVGELIFAGVGGVFGAVDAPNLFRIPSEDCTLGMRFTSAFLQALLSISWGTWLDFLMSALSLVTDGKVDAKMKIAEFIYKTVSAFFGSDYSQLKASQDNLETERMVYNAINGTNLSSKAYDDLKNRTLATKAIDGFKSIFTGKKTSTVSATESINKLKSSGLTNEQIQNMTQDQIKTALGYGNASITSTVKSRIQSTFNSASRLVVNRTNFKTATPQELYMMERLLRIENYIKTLVDLSVETTTVSNPVYTSSLTRSRTSSNGYVSTASLRNTTGYGPDNGYYKQGNYGNRIGTFLNGKVSNMRQGGCGPTALSYVHNQLMGYGPISPGEMGTYAATNGYISNGGANAGLFTEGAANLGLRGSQLGDVNQLRDSLASGRPAILSGVGSGSSNPYTNSGHIVVADGVSGNKASIMDPISGKHSMYDLNSVASKTTNAWSYSLGTGPEQNVSFLQGMKNLVGNIGNIFSKRFGFSLDDLGIGTNTSSEDIDNSGISYSNGQYTLDNNVLTSLSGTDRERFIAAAQSQVGYKEKTSSTNLKSFTANAGNGSHSKYGKEIGSTPNHWCAYFVSWAAKAAGIPTSIVYRNGSCTELYKAAINKGIFKYRGEYTPSPGDIVLYCKTGTDNPRAVKQCSHVGIVEACDGNTLVTIEGNTTDPAGSGVDGVYRKTRSITAKTIVGYIVPKWTGDIATIDPRSNLSLGYGPEQNVSFLQGMKNLIGNIGGIFTRRFGFSLDDLGIGSSTSAENTDADISSIDAADISPSDEAKQIWTTLRSRGLNAYAASGIMGNWKDESGNRAARLEGDYLKKFPGMSVINNNSALDSYTTGVLFPAYASSKISINKNAYKGKDGHYYPGIGLAQWTGPRGYNLLQYAKNNGGNWGTANTQLGFFFNELSNRSGLTDKLNKAGSPADAARIFFDGFEMYDGYSKTADGKKKVNSRGGNAQGYYDLYKNLQSSNGNGYVSTSSLRENVAYGPGPGTRKIDSPFSFNSNVKVNTKDSGYNLRTLGFGDEPLDINSDSTDGKLDKIFGLIAEWYSEAKTNKATGSTVDAGKPTVNAVVQNNHITTNRNTTTGTGERAQTSQYKSTIVNQHSMLAMRKMINQ